MRGSQETMGTDAEHQSVWIKTAPATARPSLQENISVDVAIIGAGIVGITAAYLLKDEGLRVAVLERGRILEGVTGKTTAKATSQQGAVYHVLAKRLGKEAARRHAEASEEARRTIERLAGESGADARYTVAPSHIYTTQDEHVDTLRREAKVAAQLGLPASFTTRTELPFPVRGAVRFENQAHFHPRRYLLRLAERAERAGCEIYEDTPVISFDEGDICRVTTPSAEVRARHVIVSTHVPVNDRLFFVHRMKPMREYVLALPVRGASIEGMYVSHGSPARSVRPYRDDDEGPMYIIAGEKHNVGDRDLDDHYGRLLSFAEQHFDVGPVKYYWSTQDYYPVDKLPFIGGFTPAAKRIFTATGFRAWGMTQGTMAAMILRDQILGRKNAWADLYDPHSPGRAARDLGEPGIWKIMGRATKNLVGERLTRREQHELLPGEGQVADVGGKKVAMFRGEDGVLRRYSATCTHMGCVVAWNSNEKTFDCPCHGARFGTDGAVIRGPTVRPLNRIESAPDEHARLGDGHRRRRPFT